MLTIKLLITIAQGNKIMNIEEYRNLEAVDAYHWFYLGKRLIASYWINKFIKLYHDDILIDVGCGTGRFLQEWKLTKSYGIDFSWESLNLAQNKGLNNILMAKLPQVPFKDGSAAVVVALDVLEHCLDDKKAFFTLVSLLRRGGVLFLTVPALPCLWSDWDEALNHYRRYTKYKILKIFTPNTKLLRLAYFNEIALLPAFIVRKLRKYIFIKKNEKRAEDFMLPPFINELLCKLFYFISCSKYYRPPIGLDLMLVLKRQ